ncbi:hypothetical protein [Modestobacter italicus]|uniref:hypothetical protein n=1 Tax=Modestobacter italicus (strain DSM 44449 / CECT 9708 / BC 501) TaxID=2732864 RepID=UPI001C96E1FB|nr:hypothetical protein [Modestobacter italicus]
MLTDRLNGRVRIPVEDVVALLNQLPEVSQIEAAADRANSIAAGVVRCVYDGRRTVVVDADPKTQINSLVDLVELHLEAPGVVG